MKPPEQIDLNKWSRKYCFYEVGISPNGHKYHLFWLPHRAFARIWAYYSNTDDYPEREISLLEFIENWRNHERAI